MNYRCSRCNLEVTDLTSHYERVHQGQIMSPAQTEMDIVEPDQPGLISKKEAHEKMTGRKDDQEKLRTDLLSIPALRGLAAVLSHGATKYGDRNWEKGINFSRVYAAVLRHLFAWWSGERDDPESGLPHLDHAMCGLMFLAHYDQPQYSDFDDRPDDSLDHSA